MPISKGGDGTINFTPIDRKDIFEQTGVMHNGQFAVCDRTDLLKQIKFDTASQATNTTVTVASGHNLADITVTLPATSGTLQITSTNGPAFGIVQCPAGTSPTALVPSDTLTLTSSDNSLTITGNSATDTVDFTVATAPGANKSLSNLTSPTAVNQDLLPSNDNVRDVGSASFRWNRGYFVNGVFSNVFFNSGGTAGIIFSGSTFEPDGDQAVTLGSGTFKYAGLHTVALSLYGGTADLGTGSIINLVDPTNAQDAATKHYVDNASPMTTLGDIIYENSTPAPARLAGNTTATKKYLTQTGTGSVSAAPGWNTIAAGDVPTLNQNTSGLAGTATAPAAGSAHGAVTLDSSGNFQSVAPGAASGYLRSNGTDYVRSTIQAGDVPTLNQNTSGSSGTATAPAAGSAHGGVTLDGSGNFQSVAPGAAGGYLRSNGTDYVRSTIQSGDTPLPTATTQTTAYNVAATDTIVIMDCSTTGSFTATLPSAATGRTVRIFRKDATFDITKTATISRAGSDTIVEQGTTALTTTTLATQDECVELIPDGTSVWYVASRIIPSVWTAFTPTIGGTSVAPTIATSGVLTAYWKRLGDSAAIRYEYTQTATTGAASGTGDYLFPLPANMTIDSNKANTSSSLAGTGVGAGSSLSNADTQRPASVEIHNGSNLKLMCNVGGTGYVGAAFHNFNGNAVVRFGFTAIVPITGWKG